MYWKASYQKAEAERLRLLNELAQLKEERDSSNPNDFRGSSAASKRRLDTSTQPKNKKSKISVSVDFDEGELDFDFHNNSTSPTGMSPSNTG